MNGRVCQLCGKSLGRIRVGAGGDFCSREHRNQYRLRCGMDRLMEANQISSLMRRREHLKPLDSGRPYSAAATARRAFSEPAAWKLSAPRSGRRLSARLHARMRAAIDFARLHPNNGDGGSPKMASAPARPALRRPQLPARGPRPYRASLRASVALLRYHVLDCDGNRRLCPVALRKSRTPVAFQLRCLKPADPGALRAHAACGFVLPAHKGKDLRVSTSSGFRIRRHGGPRPQFVSRTSVKMAWPQILSIAASTPMAAPDYRIGPVAMPISEIVEPLMPPARIAAAAPGLASLSLRPLDKPGARRAGLAPFVLHDPLRFRDAAGQEDEEA